MLRLITSQTDALQWVIEEAYKRNDPAELDAGKICRRLVRLNMVAIHTTSITITNTLLDLYSSPRTEEFVEGLREEVSRVLAANGGKWTKAIVNDLVRIDSTIKESIRCSSLGIVGLTRMVTSPDGIDLGDGIHVPSGVRVAAPIAGIHRDPRNYANPDEYDAFRFSPSREVLGENGQILDKRAQGIVTTSDAFLTFGHGKHACPGRFFGKHAIRLTHCLMLTADCSFARDEVNARSHCHELRRQDRRMQAQELGCEGRLRAKPQGKNHDQTKTVAE